MTATSRSPRRSISPRSTDFTLGLAFGDTRHRAITTLFQSLVTPFEASLQRFQEEWSRTARRFALAADAPDRAAALLYRAQRQSAAGARGQVLSRAR